MSKVAFLFPGQGAQAVGMGKALADQSAAVRERFEQANQLLGYDLAKLCWEGPAGQLDSTVHSQPALYVCSLAALDVLRAENPDRVSQCGYTAGLSLGEYTALVFAGVMSFEDGLKVVQTRGQAMQDAADAVSSGMVSLLGPDVEAVQALCDQVRQAGEVLQPANLLCPGNTAVSGTSEACQRLAEQAAQAGAKAIPLAVAGAFHTDLMKPAVERLREILADVPMTAPRIPVVSNVDAQPHDDPDEIRRLLIRQVISPVRWEASMRYLMNEGVNEFVEIGPGRVLRGLLRRIDRKLPCDNVEA